MKIIQFVLLLLLIVYANQRIAGQNRHVPGQLLVRLNDSVQVFHFLTNLSEVPFGNRFRPLKQISKQLNIWLFETAGDEQYALDLLRRLPEIQAAQFNHILQYRSQPPGLLPDDPFFAQQWQHLNTGAGGALPNADLDSDLAWEITTGGLTAQGDTIVVAVIDGGIDAMQEDLAPNLWHNYQEIPGDNIDNDGNGYIDDFRGWNVYADNDNITGLSTGHGTPVSALIAAKGNNGIGVTGLNWDIKLMFVAGNSQEAAILEAYDYVLTARKRFNATHGLEGAFVVAVNCSWGITFGQPANSPLWCAAFDSLGAAGILSVAATANTALDVDVQGDLPTACPSDYLISVTNLNKWDQKPGNSAWGAKSIDLGAYGKDIFTAGPNNTYGYYSGTSFAAPQVSGAIGLLYSAPCDNLIAIAKAQPAVAAILVKNALLSSATPNISLSGITVTGGRLNCNNLLQDYEDQCLDCIPPFAIAAQTVNENTMRLGWSNVADVQNLNLRWRKKGAPIWSIAFGVSNPFEIKNLQACTTYEFSLSSNCGTNNWSDWSPSVSSKTLGCCNPPAFVGTTNIGDTAATVVWSKSQAASYVVRLRPAGGQWVEYQTKDNSLVLNALAPCTNYEIALESICGIDSISTPVSYHFFTSGCGACTDKTYCTAGAASAKHEWISKVEIGSWSHTSDGGPGYEDFTRTPVDLLEILPDQILPITLKPAFSGAAYKEFFRVFIDYNADGDFDDPQELAFDPGYASDVAMSGFISTPTVLNWGPTRMRVMMKYKDWQNTAPAACESFEFGQVEDYCVHLGAAVIAAQSKSPERKIVVYPQPARDWAWVRLPEGLSHPVSLNILDASGSKCFMETQCAQQSTVPLDLTTLPTGIYLIQVRSGVSVFYQKLLVIR